MTDEEIRNAIRNGQPVTYGDFQCTKCLQRFAKMVDVKNHRQRGECPGVPGGVNYRTTRRRLYEEVVGESGRNSD